MTLINGDCLEEMKDMSDNSIDFLFADLPYGQTTCKWDCLIDLDLFWKQVNRICKQDAVMAFTCSVKFGNSLINSNPKCFRYDLIWVKSAPCGFLNAKKMPMKKHEMVYIFYRKLPKVYTENIALHHKHKFLKQDKVKYMESDLEENVVVKMRKPVKAGEHLYGNSIESPIGKYEPPLPNSVIKEENVVIEKRDVEGLYGEEKDKIRFKVNGKLRDSEPRYTPPLPNTILEIKSEKGKHATQKPIPLMEWLIKYYTREGEVVLDPTMGSGGTGIACKNLNREFIGIEKDEEIYKVAVERNS
jgi:DNA modification methylase